MAPITATAGDFWRLAEEAERRGIRILVEPFSGERFATSATHPARLYRVTGFSCTCKGFFAWQRCTHHALLLKVLGWLPDPAPEPEPAPAPQGAQPAATARCPECDGRGTERVRGATGRWFTVHCLLCGGAGRIEAGEPDDADADTGSHDAPYDAGRQPVEVVVGTAIADNRDAA